MKRVFLFVVAALVGCSGAPEPTSDYGVVPQAQPEATASDLPEEDSEPLPEEEEAPAEKEKESKDKPATPEVARYAGALEANVALTFGGGPGQCRYKMTMKGVSVALSIKGNTVSADVKNTMFEELTDVCPSSALGSQLQEFSFSGDIDPTAKIRLAMTGKSSNVPKTKLTMELTKKGDGYEAALVWSRDENQERSLLWTTNAIVTCAPTASH